MTARALMVLGTSSHVGKSLITAALCRIFAQAGYRVAPFKSQNMSLNSAATPEGLEIGRAQALQAEAAGIAPSVHMNPILLKPSGDMTSQIVVHGKIWGQLSAADYHQRRVEELWPNVVFSYRTLASEHDIVVIEGAGSPAEINLKAHDIVNLRVAQLANAACLLVGDIDRGGVFASLLGTVELLDPAERLYLKAFLINKFRGDLNLLQPGIDTIAERLRMPCLGVIPHLPNLHLEEEDSVGLPNAELPWIAPLSSQRKLRIAVIALPSLSNFTDFDSLRAEPSVSLRFLTHPAHIPYADLIILPGSKQTAADLAWLRSTGFADAIAAHNKALLVGICGGMQMLGTRITDPTGIEHARPVEGLGLLPLSTQMQPAKLTRLTQAETLTPMLFGEPFSRTSITGYEIHVGHTSLMPGAKPFALLPDGTPEGCLSADTRVLGTYLHGLFDSDPFRHAFLTAARAACHLDPAPAFENWKEKRETSLNRLADVVRSSMDLNALFSMLSLPVPA